MSRLPQIDPDTATGAAQDLLTGVQKPLGVTPNMTKVMANSPALLRGYLGLAGALDGARWAGSEDPHVAALLPLSDAVVRGRGVVSDEVWRSGRESGVTDAEVAEVVGHVALNVLTNYFNILADVDIDWPVVMPHSQAA